MSQRPTRKELLNLTLDEYMKRYVSDDDKLRSLPRGWSYNQRVRYQTTHFFGPHYERRQPTSRWHQQRQSRVAQQCNGSQKDIRYEAKQTQVEADATLQSIDDKLEIKREDDDRNEDLCDLETSDIDRDMLYIPIGLSLDSQTCHY